MKSLRDHFRDELMVMAKSDPRIVAIDCDVQSHSRLADFATAFPERFVQAGASEQHALSLAAGLARAGRLPVVASFACFISARAFEQARNSIGLQGLPVLIVGSHAGFAASEDGASHQAYDDVALFGSIPSFEIHSPADGEDIRAAMSAAFFDRKAVYMRYGRKPVPELQVECDLASGFRVVKKGAGVIVLTTGEVVHEIVGINLDEIGVDVGIVHVSQINPLPAFPEMVRCASLIIVIEDHYRTGGLFSAVSEVFSEAEVIPKIASIGIGRRFGETGTDAGLRAAMAMDRDSILQRIKRFIDLHANPGQ